LLQVVPCPKLGPENERDEILPWLIPPEQARRNKFKLHTLAMLAMATAMAIATYERLGLEILRRAWTNVDLIWTLALAVAGAILLGR
jgi:hypothetical protein